MTIVLAQEPNDDPLEDRARKYLTAWRLSKAVRLTRSRTGLVLRVEREGGDVAVLKCLSHLGQREEGTAPAALREFAGVGAVCLLKADKGAHLIEYCDGPDILRHDGGHRDDVAIPILVDTIARLRTTGTNRPPGVPTLAQRCEAIERTIERVDGDVASRLLRAREIAAKLLTDQTATLLHGDLHHENVLRTCRSGRVTWLAIDPQGVWGDPAYEVANLFGNPCDHPNVTLARDRPLRLAATFERSLGLAPRRTLGWAYVHSCISAAWSIEDGLDPSYRLSIADRVGAVF